ncbi:lgc-32, partial [Pristionchus pacificus]
TIAVMLLYLFLPVLVWSCTSDQEIIAQLRRKNIGRNNVGDVELELHVDNAKRLDKENAVFVEGYVLKKWNDGSLNFESQDPCSDSVIVSDVSHPVHLSETILQSDATVTKNGTVTVKELISMKETCTVKDLEFPVRSMRCALKFPLKKSERIATWANAPTKNSLFELSSSEMDDFGVEVILKYKLPFMKVIIEFFLPAVIFMGISWLSLALGPMSITRSILIIGSFILLMRHFSYPPIEIGQTGERQISAIAVWKTFSYIFVLSTLVELVVVTCLMSMSKGPSCCRKRSGEYDFEPVYEELNDLRKRDSLANGEYKMRYAEKRTGCSCCRFFALFLDLTTMVFLATALILFIILYFNDDFNLVEQINNFSLDKIIKL